MYIGTHRKNNLRCSMTVNWACTNDLNLLLGISVSGETNCI